MRLLAAIALFALIVPAAARAELASRPESRPTVTIAVLGDSLGEGLWASLYRHFARERAVNARVRLVNASRASTGFNANAYDAMVDKLLARGRIDLLIVQAGANDRQRALALDGQSRAPFGSPLWHSYYSQRLTYFLARLQRQGVLVLWVGLPVMRDAPFDGGMRLITRMHQEHAERHGAMFLDIARFTADAEGAYIATLAIGRGRERRLRHEDGIHFGEFGYDRLAAHVLATIRTRFPRLLPEGEARVELLSHKP